MKRMLITGASRGLGAALAKRFSDTYEVITLSKFGTNCDYALDLTVAEDLAKACTIECDVLINNAGIASNNLIESFFTNVVALIELSKINHERMTEGAIINISSVSASYPTRLRSIPDNYIITKTVVSKFTDLLINLKKAKIKVCCIEPELINTDMIKSLPNRIKRASINPNEIADVVYWILQMPEHISLSNAVLRYV